MNQRITETTFLYLPNSIHKLNAVPSREGNLPLNCSKPLLKKELLVYPKESQEVRLGTFPSLASLHGQLPSKAKRYQYQFLPFSVFHSGKRKSLYLYSMKPVPFLRPLCLFHSPLQCATLAKGLSERVQSRGEFMREVSLLNEGGIGKCTHFFGCR